MTSGHVDSAARRATDAAEQRRQAILADVSEGLSRTPRELPPKYFYDERGSQLFEDITRLDEYYLTRAEREILLVRAGEIAAASPGLAPRTLVELGAGSAAKSRILLAAMHEAVGDVTYVPVDVSEEFLEQTREALEREDPSLAVVPLVADISASLDLPASLPQPVLFAFLGSTIGNFDGPDAIALLRRVLVQMHPGDRLLLGTDLRKDCTVLEAAYNDSLGVTAEFNRNMLRVVNHELGSDFDPERFVHRAIYNDAEHRIEMYLHSDGAQTVCVPGMGLVSFADGEAIRTELSYKYDRAAVDALALAACLRVTEWFTDTRSQFGLSVLEPLA